MSFELFIGEFNIIGSYEVNERTAVRAVIFQEDSILMVKNNKGDYKFPGGGVDPNENFKDALLREIEEETGYTNVEVGAEIGQVIEQQVDHIDDSKYFRMKSIYYLCKLNNMENVGQNLDDYEEKQEFTAEFISIQKAIDTNMSILTSNNSEKNKWVERETKVLEMIEKTINLSIKE